MHLVSQNLGWGEGAQSCACVPSSLSSCQGLLGRRRLAGSVDCRFCLLDLRTVEFLAACRPQHPALGQLCPSVQGRAVCQNTLATTDLKGTHAGTAEDSRTGGVPCSAHPYVRKLVTHLAKFQMCGGCLWTCAVSAWTLCPVEAQQAAMARSRAAICVVFPLSSSPGMAPASVLAQDTHTVQSTGRLG